VTKRLFASIWGERVKIVKVEKEKEGYIIYVTLKLKCGEGEWRSMFNEFMSFIRENKNAEIIWDLDFVDRRYEKGYLIIDAWFYGGDKDKIIKEVHKLYSRFVKREEVILLEIPKDLYEKIEKVFPEIKKYVVK